MSADHRSFGAEGIDVKSLVVAGLASWFALAGRRDRVQPGPGRVSSAGARGVRLADQPVLRHKT